MRTNTQQSNPENPLIRKIGVQTIAAILALAMAFTFNACSSDDSDGSSGGSSSLESLLANNHRYQQSKKEAEYYDPDNSEERCTAAGVVERMCVNEWYNPLKQQYCSDGVEVATYAACGGKLYYYFPIDGDYKKCENNVVLMECANEWYNIETHSCYSSSNDVHLEEKDLCNGIRFRYYEGYTECRDGVVKSRCGDLWYNKATEYCDDNDGNKVKPLLKCDGMYMNGYELADGSVRCATDGKTFERKCGYSENAQWYNPITQACNENDYTLKNKIKCSK